MLYHINLIMGNKEGFKVRKSLESEQRAREERERYLLCVYILLNTCHIAQPSNKLSFYYICFVCIGFTTHYIYVLCV